MSDQWRRIGRVLLVASVVLLAISSGIAVADEEHGTETPTTTTAGHSDETGHHDEASTQTSAAGSHHNGTSPQSGTSTQHGDDEHAHDGEETGTSTTPHNDSAQQGDDGHTHEGDGHSEEGLFGSWLSVVGGLFLVGAVATAPTYRYLSSNRDGFEATAIHFAVALLALFTAAVHLYLFIEHGEVIMLLAGGGFIGGIVLFFTGFNRQHLYASGALFTLAQISLWIVEGMPHLDSFGLLDKVVQVLFVLLLGYLFLQNR
ncbi:hypothetical protein SAMN04487950_3791 [Halogranum rubrum]|uniref:Uncharacterized protein n=1 Tax=Halogranum rubrum TaxID=553466 RepID=A0A1I4HSK0_9EURY|nr:hypothetical protein [Halogranum rubrum]SFL44773.1 hypothetical protein SAMN04487950_3791 [Halogranum rubrum]